MTRVARTMFVMVLNISTYVFIGVKYIDPIPHAPFPEQRATDGVQIKIKF